MEAIWKTAESVDSYKLRATKYQSLVQHAIKNNLISDEQPVIDVFDFDEFDARLQDLLSAFPEEEITHGLAVKSQPLSGVLRYAIEKHPRIGTECASLQEAIHGRNLGAKPENVIYDSPVKSKYELREAMKQGFYINLDNYGEMKMVAEVLKEIPDTKSTFGLRVNPLVEGGAIAALSTAGANSKFGLIMCEETFPQILAYYQEFPWLAGIHCHVGSQGCPIEMGVHGCKRILEGALKINDKLGKKQITCLDIGGGVPTSYWTDEEAHSFAEYRQMLDEKVPELFKSGFRILTEFGRSMFAKYGCTLTKVAFIKGSDEKDECLISKYRASQGQNQLMLVFVGSNSFVREAYQMDIGKWRRRFTLFDKNGEGKFGDFKKQDIAGPLCFQGDYLCKDVPLPENANDEDVLVMHDTGAYTMAMYSKYNSRPCQAVYGKFGDELKCIKERETNEDCLKFWG